jgi:outer membrane lipoprotein-sorting protein
MTSSKGRWILCALVGLSVPLTVPSSLRAADATPQAAAQVAAAVPKLSAEQIIEKYYAARGGLAAWRGVTSMSYSGKMDAGYADSAARSARYVSGAAAAHNAKTGKQALLAMEAEQSKHANDKQVQLPFTFELKRPNKERVEIEFAGKTAVQVYDGEKGWLKRPYLNRDDWEPFSPEQAKMQAAEPGIDGLLFDYTKRGIKVAFDKVEPVEGHDAYKLALTMKDGKVRHVWIDAQSFLDVKIEGTPRQMDGKMRTVYVYQRDFRPVNGLILPFVLETAIDGYRDTHKMVIEKVALNPLLDDSMFVRPKAS